MAGTGNIFIRTFFLSLLFAAFSRQACKAYRADDANLAGSAVWNGRLWYLVEAGKGDEQYTYRYQLYSAPADGPGMARPEKGITAAGETYYDCRPRLLAGEDRLWFISCGRAGWYKDGKLTINKLDEKLVEPGHPFLFQGRPAVLDRETYGTTMLKIFTGGRWEPVKEINVPPGTTLRAAAASEGIYLFSRSPEEKEILYYLMRTGGGGEIPEDAWKPVARAARGWRALTINDKPAIIALDGTRWKAGFNGVILENGSWREFFSGPDIYLHQFDFTALPSGGGADFYIVRDTMGGAIRSMAVRGSKAEKEKIVALTADALGFYPFLAIIFFAVFYNLFIRLAPFYYLSLSLTPYKEKRNYPKGRVDLDAIFKDSYSDSTAFTIRRSRKRKALLITNVDSAERGASAGIVYFKETPSGTDVEFESRHPVMTLWMFLLFPWLIAAGLGGLLPFPKIAVVIVGIIATYSFVASDIKTYRNLHKNGKDFFDLFLTYIGVEEDFCIVKVVFPNYGR